MIWTNIECSEFCSVLAIKKSKSLSVHRQFHQIMLSLVFAVCLHRFMPSRTTTSKCGAKEVCLRFILSLLWMEIANFFWGCDFPLNSNVERVLFLGFSSSYCKGTARHSKAVFFRLQCRTWKMVFVKNAHGKWMHPQVMPRLEIFIQTFQLWMRINACRMLPQPKLYEDWALMERRKKGGIS